MLLALALSTPAKAPVPQDGADLAQTYAQEVTARLDVPEAAQKFYADLLAERLRDKNLTEPQYAVLVDSNKFVQAAMVFWLSPDGTYHFIGASPVSTGKPGRFDYFTTPTGVFEHSLYNPDFRAEGTKNEHGIRGYGLKGIRVFDFGWQQAEKGWGRGGQGTMRLQMHATDPANLEKRLGTAQSKGCIRIPATLNLFLDHHGILDADYERALSEGHQLWVMAQDRAPTRWPGRYLVIVDSGAKSRPSWSPLPHAKSAGRVRHESTFAGLH